MNQTVSFDRRTTHPLSGLESWPKTGPVYGFADDESAPRATTFWRKLSDRIRKSPSGDASPMPQARVWY